MLQLERKEECSGCYACHAVCPQNCITMKADTEEFWYPKVEKDTCIQCNLCNKVCPISNERELTGKNAKTISAYAAYHKNELVRLKSSSGGIFSILAETILKRNGVVFGAAYNKKFQIVHKYIEHIEDIYQLQGSKYVQSKIGNTFMQAKHFLEEGREVLFSGTPCQIAGLKKFLSKEYEKLYCQDMICHGVPSPLLWSKYLDENEKEGKQIVKVSFKDKRHGWSKCSMSFQYSDGTTYCKTLEKDLYMRAFLKDICLRPSCYECNFKSIEREADITLADYWGIEKQHREMYDNKGTSLVILHSQKAHRIWEIIKGTMVTKEVDVNEAIKYNPSAITSANRNEKREEFYVHLNEKGLNQAIKIGLKEKLHIQIKNKCIHVARKVKKKMKNKM